MNCNLVILKKLSEYPTICPESFNTISNILTSGVGFLGRLWYFINKGMGTNDEATAKRTARLMYIYSILGVRQSTQLTLLSPLYKKAGATQPFEVTLAVLKDQSRISHDRLWGIQHGIEYYCQCLGCLWPISIIRGTRFFWWSEGLRPRIPKRILRLDLCDRNADRTTEIALLSKPTQSIDHYGIDSYKK